MRVNIRSLLIATVIVLIVVIPSAVRAQHKHQQVGQPKTDMAGMQPDMSMMKSPHHMLVTAHLNSMSEFARTLRAEAVKPEALDVEFARAAVAEIRHNLDAIESIHQQHMQGMNAAMRAKKQMMMEKMEKDRTTLNNQVRALETDVQGSPANRQVLADTDALLKHLGMMSKMHGGTKATKMEMKKM